jgi:hypothetical protein
MEFDRKFIDTIELNDWEVETDTGWSDIKAIGKTIEYDEWIVKTKHCELICADTHILFVRHMLLSGGSLFEVFAKDLNINTDFIWTKYGFEKVLEVYKTDKKSNMFDLQLNDKNHRFYTNDILSHNSMWLQNIGAKITDSGYNVVYVTLEMSKRNCMKRIGSMRLHIDNNQYDEVSKDTIYMKNKINELKSMAPSNKLFDSGKAGKLFVRKYPTSDCTVTDIENFIKKFEEVKKIKIDVMIVDYINIMSIEKGETGLNTMLYLKGKHLAEGLRRIADKFDLAIITATQVDKSVWGANDVNLADIPESKAIAESADSVWAIIRNEQMKKENIYRLKILKLRTGEHHEEQIQFNFNTKYLTIENDILLGSKNS